MKKTYKTLLVALAFMFVITSVGVKAVESVYLCVPQIIEMSKFTTLTTQTKKNPGDQSVNLVKASTSMTNPCPNCELWFQVENTASGYKSNVITLKSGQTKRFATNDATIYGAGRYELQAQRLDFSLLKTAADFIWYLTV